MVSVWVNMFEFNRFEQNKVQQKSRLGLILVKRSYITQEELNQALKYQSKSNLKLGEVLLKLNLIDQKQLTRALRRQNWVRSITAGVALVLAPLSPAFAASQGTSGSSSSASSQISVTISPQSVTNSTANLALNAKNQPSQESEGLCTSNLGADIYRIQAAGSGANGQFVLLNDQNKKVSYQVAYKHQNHQFEKLNLAKASSNFHNQTPTILCGDSHANRLKVSLNNPQFVSSASSYSGVLTVTIVPE